MALPLPAIVGAGVDELAQVSLPGRHTLNADLYRSAAHALVTGAFSRAGYVRVHIHDCWAAKERADTVSRGGWWFWNSQVRVDYLASRNPSLGLYSHARCPSLFKPHALANSDEDPPLPTLRPTPPSR
eukprot:COSAG01_NODE_6056_length_3876_cov_9.951019_9_plen_128_part_00